VVRRGLCAQERAAALRRDGAARYAARHDESRHFVWLFENSVGFNRFLVRQLNERLGQFIGLLEYGRTLEATARLARSIASLFNPILYPDLSLHLDITQEEIGALSGISRQNANQCLKRLEKEGLLRLNMVVSPSSTLSGCATMVSIGAITEIR
jgi:CRP-like cAMP-binding protein